MKQLFIGMILVLAMMQLTQAGTCTSISRTNSSSLQVLTASKYNTDHNTAYSAINNFDGGCVTDGTLESSALNTTDFAVLLKGVQIGCKVTYTNASTLSISKCASAVNGALLNKTSATSVSFGCSNCSSEVSATVYYVYIQTGSSGTTLTPLILTTAPNEDGYDNSGNKVIARFYNNTSSDIDQFSIDQWSLNKFTPGNTAPATYTPTTSGLGTISLQACVWAREGAYAMINCKWVNGTVAASEAQFGLPGTAKVSSLFSSGEEYIVGGWGYNGSSANKGGHMIAKATNAYLNFSPNSVFGSTSSNPLTVVNGTEVGGSTTEVNFWARVPIQGWGE